MSKCSRIILFLVILTCLAPSLQDARAERGPSTVAERTRAVQVAKSLRTDPLSPEVQNDREWVIKWLIEIPDISVNYCTNFLGDLGDKKNGYSGALIASIMANEASFIIEHPDKSRDVNAIYFAGVDGALDSYQAIQKQDTQYHLAHLDELLHMREQGKLKDYVRATAKTCKKKN
jgi:hypothetical protein